jgi:hypothetical protein
MPFILADSAGKTLDVRKEESNRHRRPIPDNEWRSILASVRRALADLDSSELHSLARRIADGIRQLDDLMTKYCAETCPLCEDPCCDGKDVFYNQADLVYLTALGAAMPPGQTRSRPMEPCRYLGADGCILSRLERPYVCVWFLCDAQMRLLQGEKAVFQRNVVQVMQDIRSSRLMLETLLESALFKA